MLDFVTTMPLLSSSRPLMLIGTSCCHSSASGVPRRILVNTPPVFALKITKCSAMGSLHGWTAIILLLLEVSVWYARQGYECLPPALTSWSKRRPGSECAALADTLADVGADLGMRARPYSATAGQAEADQALSVWAAPRHHSNALPPWVQYLTVAAAMTA